MKKNLIKFLTLLLAALLPAIALLGIGIFTPAQYGKTFLGALAPKFARLTTLDEPKIVVVGGSSAAFGLDSALLAETVGMPVVNFGLYATLGTKLMLDLSLAGIGEGDIVVLAPETDEQTLSLYFNAESTWQAVEADPSMLRYVGTDNWGAMLGASFGYLGAKLTFLREGAPDPDGVYNSRNFNAYGDIAYDRPYNTMLLGYDPNMTISLSADIVDDAFLTYVNDYIGAVRQKGAEVYFSFPPMNGDALAADTTEESVYAFYDFLSRNLDCAVISNPHAYIYDAAYFYDTNFHLNDSGVILRTAALAADLRRMLGDTRPVEIELPEPPARPVTEQPEIAAPDDGTDYVSCFTYADIADGLMITGVTDAGKTKNALTVPAEANGKKVLAIGENAFSGCTALAEIVIYPNVVQFFDGCFRGASALRRVVMQYTVAEGVSVGEGLFAGAPDSVKLYFPSAQAYGNYVADYYWSAYATRMDILE